MKHRLLLLAILEVVAQACAFIIIGIVLAHNFPNLLWSP